MRSILFLALGVLLSVESHAGVRLYARNTQPAACVTGDYWVDTDGTAGEKFYVCEATNTWVRQVGYGTGANPSWLSIHASSGNLAAANKQVTKAWQTGLPYTASVTSVIHGGKHWIAKTTHTAGSTTEPGVGASYADAWEESGGSAMSWPASDGAYYAAKDGAWASLADVYQPLDSDLTTFSGLACTEGQIPKKNSSSVWICGSDVEGAGGGISHATSDGNYYASRNGAWASLTGLFAAALGTDDNYATDAEKVKLSNLSGTNTGDQTLPTDATLTTTDVTTNNATTSKHGWLLKATAPASGLRNLVAIDNGETVYKNAALFDATSPSTQALSDSAVVGTAMTAARRDHKHAMPAPQTTISGNAGTATALAANGANCSAGQAPLGVNASGAAEGCWTPSTGSMTYPSANNFGWTTNGTSWTAMGLDADISTVSASDDTVPSAKATKTALDLKANASSIAFEAATWSDLKILDTTHTTAGTGIALVQDSMAYANADDAYHLWSIDKIGSELAGKLAIASIDDAPVDSETAAPISSNWAYDHVAAADPHSGYMLESAYAAYTVTKTNMTLDTAGTGNAITVPLNGVLDGAITDPVDANDMIYARAANAMTVTGIDCQAEGTTPSITITLQKCNDLACGTPTDIEAAITCDTDGGVHASTIDSASISADTPIKVLFGAPSGTVTSVRWRVIGTQTW